MQYLVSKKFKNSIYFHATTFNTLTPKKTKLYAKPYAPRTIKEDVTIGISNSVMKKKNKISFNQKS